MIRFCTMNIFQMLIDRILLLVALVTLVTLVIELSGIFGTMFIGMMHIKSNLRIETIGTAIGSMTILEMIIEVEVKNDFHVYLQLSPMQSS